MRRILPMVPWWIMLVGSIPYASGQEVITADPTATDAAVLQRIRDLEWQVQQLSGRESERAAETASFVQPCAACQHTGSPCRCPQGGTAAKSAFPTAKLTGFFQLDMGFYDQDAANVATLGDIQNGLGFRRARLAAVGSVSEQTSYIMEFDFAQAQARFVDVWMQFAETPLGNVRIGRFRQPFGMTELTSIRELPFLERPLLFGTDLFFRQTGVMLFDSAAEDRLTWAVSGFRYISDNFGNVYADEGGYGVETRLTALPVDLGDRVLHFGVDYSYKEPGRGLVQLANTNEFFLGQNPILGAGGLSVLPLVNVPPFVNTGQIAARREQEFNVEAAMGLGRLAVQSEARWAFVEDNTGVVNTFPGFYAHVRYMLTGEVIPFNKPGAVFGRIKPACPANFRQGDWGAWELAARVSYIDLNGTNLPGPGRRLTDTTVGLNWYVNDRTKFQFNWIHAELNDLTLGDSRADTFAFRGQLDY